MATYNYQYQMPMPAAPTATIYPAAPVIPPPAYSATPTMPVPAMPAPLYPSIPSEKKDIKNQEKEIKEAIEVINEAILHLDRAISKISSASDWGMYDTLCDGGCLSSMIKQDKMTEANREMALANKSVKKLKEEIKDIENIEAIEISELLSFMDVFFDNIFSDMMVQSKIAEAERKCKKARRQLDTLRKELKERLEPKTISEMQSEKKFKMDQEENIKKAFEVSNKSIEILQSSIRKFDKAIEWTSDDSCICCFGCLGFMFVDGKVNDLKIKLRTSIRTLDELTNNLKKVSIDISNRSEYLKFIDMSKDIVSCNNTSFDRYASNTFREAKKSCLQSISEIESIRNELKDLLVKKNIKY